jgi:5,10-methylenetetrahydromethanopterin reductase
MRIGIMLGATQGPDGTLKGLEEHAKKLEELGFASLWLAHVLGLDAITCLALLGNATSRIELGTGVVPTYPRHPVALAQQALTAAAASGGRFTLGIGLSHKVLIEDMLGLSYEKPVRHMREYLEVLGPLLRGEPTAHQGEVYRVQGALMVKEAPTPVPVLVAALGPAMLRVAGRLAQGTITWMTGSKTLSSHIVPGIRAAAEEAGQPEPRLVAGFPIAVTDDVPKARQKAGETFALYGTLPSYRAMLDREGLAGPGDIALLGSEEQVSAELDRIAETGVTDFIAAITPVDEGARERTLELLASRLPG